MHSNVLLIGYAEHVKAWADQVKISLSKGPALSYTFSQIGESNKTNKITVVKTMPEPYGTIADNTYSPHKLEPSAIPYSID